MRRFVSLALAHPTPSARQARLAPLCADSLSALPREPSQSHTCRVSPARARALVSIEPPRGCPHKLELQRQLVSVGAPLGAVDSLELPERRRARDPPATFPRVNATRRDHAARASGAKPMIARRVFSLARPLRPDPLDRQKIISAGDERRRRLRRSAAKAELFSRGDRRRRWRSPRRPEPDSAEIAGARHSKAAQARHRTALLEEHPRNHGLSPTRRELPRLSHATQGFFSHGCSITSQK